MKANTSRGASFGGLVAYINQMAKDAEYICGTAWGSTEDILRSFNLTARIRPDIKKPVWHCSLSLPAPDDDNEGEYLSADKWAAVAEDFMREMGFEDGTVWTAHRHRDREHDHIHIAASRINLSGEVWYGRYEKLRAIEVTQLLERRHGLRQTQGLRNKGRKRLTRGEFGKALRTKELPPRLKIARIIDGALTGGPSLRAFIDRCALGGVSVMLNKSKTTGHISGISFGVDGVSFKGSGIGNLYTWGSLKKRGLSDGNDERDRSASDIHGQHYDCYGAVSKPGIGDGAGRIAAARHLALQNLPGGDVAGRQESGNSHLSGHASAGIRNRLPALGLAALRRPGAGPANPRYHIPGPGMIVGGGAGDISEINAERGYVAMQLAAVRAAFGGR